jgi:hypothetical protein
MVATEEKAQMASAAAIAPSTLKTAIAALPSL